MTSSACAGASATMCAAVKFTDVFRPACETATVLPDIDVTTPATWSLPPRGEVEGLGAAVADAVLPLAVVVVDVGDAVFDDPQALTIVTTTTASPDAVAGNTPVRMSTIAPSSRSWSFRPLSRDL